MCRSLALPFRYSQLARRRNWQIPSVACHATPLQARNNGHLRSGAADHHFGGLDEGHGVVAGFEGEFADCVGRDDGGDALIANGEDHLGEQAFDFDLDDGAEQLVAAADASGAGMGGGGGQEFVQRFERERGGGRRGFSQCGCGRQGSSA